MNSMEKSIMSSDLCLECAKGNDVVVLEWCISKYGVYTKCENGHKKQITKKETKEQRYNRLYPGRKEKMKELRKKMRESAKRANFQGIKIEL